MSGMLQPLMIHNYINYMHYGGVGALKFFILLLFI